MTTKAAGILFVSPNQNALFLKRGESGDFTGYWCLPGGHIEGSETPEQAAMREAIEEIGFLPKGERAQWTHTIKDYAATGLAAQPAGEPTPAPPLVPVAPANPIDFTTFIQNVKEQFEPAVNNEHVGHAWAPLSDPPQPLHPGVAIALRRFGMDELGVARAIAAGELSSPQRYHNMSLFAMRITGTGVAYRRALNEFVYRRPEHYLNEEFLARCNGLPVILMHPAKAILNSKEYNDRNVGSMFLTFIGDGANFPADEVWGVAKIFDDEAIALLISDKMSTSPSVLLRTTKDTAKMTLEDGSTLLIEGKPSLLDHLAICEQGVWDKGEAPSGVESALARGDSQMATPEEEEAKKKADAEMEAKKKADAEAEEEAKKADADAGTKLDKILSCMDAMDKRMDGFESKMDAMDKAKADAAKKDGEDDPEFLKKKADAEAEEKKKADAAAEEEAKKKADAAAEDEKKKADAKADSDISDVRKRIDKVEQMLPKQVADADYHALTDVQAKADGVFQAHGLHAPRFMQGEGVVAYRKRIASTLKAHSAVWKGIDLSAFPDDSFAIAESQIYNDAMVAAVNPVDLPEFVLRPITTVDHATGQRSTRFVGKNTFISQLKRPSRRVAHIGAPRKDN